jgi:hypothetical protein
MIPNTLFLKQPPKFWAYVRSISQTFGYTVRGKGQIKVPSIAHMGKALNKIGLDSSHLSAARVDAPPIGEVLHAYFQYRAETLNTFVERIRLANPIYTVPNACDAVVGWTNQPR